MKQEIKNLENSKKELIISLDFEEFKKFIDEATEELIKEVELPGFRKGKAPKELAIKNIKEFDIYEKAAKLAATKNYLDYISSSNLEPLTSPDIEVLKLAPNNEFSFKATFYVIPEIDLDNYQEKIKHLKNQKKEVNVEEQEIEESLNWLLKSRTNYEKSNSEIKIGDKVKLDFDIKEDGLIIDSQKDFEFITGEKQVFEDFEKNILGLKEGDTKNFSVEVPSDYWSKDLAGKNVDFEIKIKEVYNAISPILNDEFAKGLGSFKSLVDLKESLKTGLLEEKKNEEEERFRVLILKELAKIISIDLPPVLIDREIAIMIEELRNSVNKNNLDWNMYLKQINKTEDDLRIEFKDRAIERIKIELILRKIAQEEQIEPSEEEIEKEVNKYLLQFSKIEQAKNNIDEQELKIYIKSILTNQKVTEFLEKLIEN
jgi:trigger factor